MSDIVALLHDAWPLRDSSVPVQAAALAVLLPLVAVVLNVLAQLVSEMAALARRSPQKRASIRDANELTT